MGFLLSKYFDSTPSQGALPNFMFKKTGLSSYTFLAKCTELTKSDLEYQWPLWRTLEIPKLNILKTKLDYSHSKFSRTEWYANSNW